MFYLLLFKTLIKLWTCFEDRDMPYFWSPDCNLLAILTDQQINEYTKVLYQICERLTQYPHERQLSYKITAKHFRVYN